ncbi:hypothetical protein G6F22_015358 [Rhizopus arrhizus]|nr:hypothetical protein G6F22_015358 [Rhizopus arrhizus]
MTVATLAWPVMAIVSPSGTLRRPASVTKPERRLCAEKSPSRPASLQRSCTMSRAAAAARGSPMTSPRRTRRKIGPWRMPLAASHASNACAAEPTMGFWSSARCAPD